MELSMVKGYYLLIFAVCIIVCLSVLRNQNKNLTINNKPYTKKKIIILTTADVSGNRSASNAIEEYLKNDYDIEQCPVLKEILAPLDPFNFLTFKNYSGEQLYNDLIPGKHFELLGWVYKFGKWYMQSQKNEITHLLREYFIRKKPDLIVSVMPIVNPMVLDVAQELNIPFLLAPTDLDISPFIIRITNPTYKKFHISLPFYDRDLVAPIKKALIAPHHIHISGMPLGKTFLKPHNRKNLQQKYNINPEKPVIMLLMGSHGADEIKNYVVELIKINSSFHILACIGKNEKSRKDLSDLSIPPHISMDIVGFTKHIDEYMAISDVLITKSGTLSVCEALYMNLPLLLDATSNLLPWEKFNHYFIKKHEMGMSIKHYPDIVPLIENILKNPAQLKTYKQNIKNLEKKDCSRELKKLVKQILE
jgi:processive 1,2-diacylglycerol beta-glucosyltransferase